MTKATQSVLPDQAARHSILHNLDKTLLVEAAAGTGKTTCMVGRMVRLLAEGKCRIGTLAAVTFTRKAAAELRERFMLELQRTAASTTGDEHTRLAGALSRIEQCFIGTVHSFCGRLLRERPIEAGVDLEFQELEEEADAILREQAWRNMAAHLHAMGDPLLTELDELGLAISDLRPAYEMYSLYPDVEEWPAKPVPLPDLAPVKKKIQTYVDHIEELLPNLPSDAGNDELIPLYQRIPRFYRNTNLSKTSEVMEFLGIFRKVKIVQRQWQNNQMGIDERDRMYAFVDNVADPLLCQWREYRYATVMQVIARGAAEYERLKRDSGLLNFQDLLLLAARLLRNRPNIRTYFRKRFTHILVDEFQDTDPIQAEVMLLLTANDPNESDWRKCRPVPGSLFVVGDPKQSIYRFRRADIETYNEVRKIIQSAGGEVVQLSTNFRTIPRILEWVNAVFNEKFAKAEDSYSPMYVNLQPGRVNEVAAEKPFIAVLEIPDQLRQNEAIVEWEARQIATMIESAINDQQAKTRPGDFLIITWGRKHLSQYAEALRERGIPHEVTGGTGLNETHCLRLLQDCLTALSRPDDPVALVAVLRGELFGFSDIQLYQFRKAGGRFCFHSGVPQCLEEETSTAFTDAFERLRKYARWIHALPAVAAVEKMIDDLGLLVLAAAHPGGNEQAGALAKAVELLRSRETLFWSFSTLVETLQRLVEQEEKQDAISLLPASSDRVRIMNLHKVKGLEAPVVFLSDPTGKSDHPVKLHVTRRSGKVLGYLAVHSEQGPYGNSNVLAQPIDWETLKSEEKKFEEAEKIRLFYVAATRAGSQMVITQRGTFRNRNYWDFFADQLNGYPRLPDFDETTMQQVEEFEIPPESWKTAVNNIAQHWEKVTAVTYQIGAAKELSRTPHPSVSSAGGLGPDWGSLIHTLLELAVKNPQADLHTAAIAQIEEYEDLDRNLIPYAVEVVESVLRSDIWARARRSSRCLAEVPFHMVQESAEGIPSILRGQVDLVFEERDGWVIVDYKTDHALESELPALAEYYRPQLENYATVWEQATGGKVTERGLYFTTAGVYLTLE